MPDPQKIGYDAQGNPLAQVGYDKDGNPITAPIKEPGAFQKAVDWFKATQTGTNAMNPALDVSLGMAKGLGGTVLNVADLAARATGAAPTDPFRASVAAAQKRLKPSNLTQGVGRAVEQVAELAYPASQITRAAKFVSSALPTGAKLLSRVGIEAAGGAGLAAAQGGDPTTGAALGAAGGAIAGPTGAGIERVGKFLGERAPRMVLSAVKPTVTAIKQEANASRVGLNMTAERLAKYMIDNRLTTPKKAQAIIDGAEAEIKQILQSGNALTDAGERAKRYLSALERSASRQGIPAYDVGIIRQKAAAFMRSSPLTKSEQAVDAAGNLMFDKQGNPVMIRVVRDDVMADEALEIGRATSRFRTKKQYGELKGMGIESDKAVERAVRDAAKAAVPPLREVLNREGKAISARQLLDRMLFRQGNRDPLSLTDSLFVISQLERGKLPTLGAINHWFRNGGAMKAGIYSDTLAKAIAGSDVRKALETVALVAAVESSKPFASHEPTK